MKNQFEDYKKEARKFVRTDEGKKILLFVGIGILVGILWKILLITLVIGGVVYLIYKKRTEANG